MTGFSNLLRRLLCLPPKQDRWEEARKSRISLLTPAKIKIAVRNERQIEYKIDYLVSPGLPKQVYDVRLYLFFSTELDAAETSFYRSLYSAVRLHTPKTNVRELSGDTGSSTSVGAIAASIQVVKAKLASGEDIDTDATHLVYQLQLYACTFRRAIRRTVKHILAKLLDSTDMLPSEAAECRAAADICELLDASTAAVHTLQKVCRDCEDAKMPDWLRDAWHLVEEAVLLEEHTALLKLGVKLEAIYRPPSEDLDSHPLQAKMDCPISSSGDGLPKSCEELKGQALNCLRHCTTLAAQRPSNTASPESDSQQPGSSGSLPTGPRRRSFDIEEGAGGTPMNSPEPQQAAEMDDHTSQWQLSAESKSSSARGITSLVFVNPRALYSALNRYSMAVTDKLASTLQHSLSSAGYHPGPPSSSAHQAAEADGSPQEGGSLQMPRSRRLLASARRLLLEHVQAVEALAGERGYTESLLQDGDPTEHEQYTNRVKILKRHAQLAITLAPRMRRRSMLVDDIVGMTIAGVAMAFALSTMYWAFRSSAQYGILYIAIYIIGYMFKDRIKEWGKRYLQPIAEWFGIYFPDRVQKFRDYFGNAVGSCSEGVRIKDGLDVSPRVLAMRYAGHKSGPPSKKHVVKPERVLVYTKKMEVRWRALEADLQGVRSLDDVIRIDLDFLLRAMQPPHETHYALFRDSSRALGVNEVQTARVYHVNSVLELRTQAWRNSSDSIHMCSAQPFSASCCCAHNCTPCCHVHPRSEGALKPRRTVNLRGDCKHHCYQNALPCTFTNAQVYASMHLHRRQDQAESNGRIPILQGAVAKPKQGISAGVQTLSIDNLTLRTGTEPGEGDAAGEDAHCDGPQRNQAFGGLREQCSAGQGKACALSPPRCGRIGHASVSSSCDVCHATSHADEVLTGESITAVLALLYAATENIQSPTAGHQRGVPPR